MLNVQLDVTSKTIGENHIRWSIEHDNQQFRLTAQLLRCESRFGPYDPIGEAFDPRLIDRTTDHVPAYKILRRWYYKIRITEHFNQPLFHGDPPDFLSKAYEFPADFGASTERRIDPEARLLASDSELRYRNHGQAVIYFPVRTWGPRCPRCFDSVTSSQLLSDCPACWGTTFAAGFLYPIRVWIMLEFQNTIPSSANSSGMPLSGAMARARLPWFIDAKPGDVVVDENNNRWKVQDEINVVRKRGCVIRTECNLGLIPQECIEYKLPVPEQIMSVQRSWQYTPDALR